MPEESKIEKYINDAKNLPVWIQYTVAIATIFGTVFGGWGMYILLNQAVPTQTVAQNSISENATSTINISDLLSKALALETVVERQDFLAKYVGDHVYGEGEVKQVSRYGENFLIDFNINRQTIVCPQEKNVENEKQLLLLKGKTTSFYGTFTFQEYFDHKGLLLEDCVIQKKF